MQPMPLVWMRALCSGSIPAVLDLYTEDAVLVPTYDKSTLPGAGLGVLVGKLYIVNYFNRFMAKQGLCGTIDTIVAQPLGPVTVFSGTYTFNWVEKGKAKQAKARYTFVAVGSKIATQHSSALPGA